MIEFCLTFNSKDELNQTLDILTEYNINNKNKIGYDISSIDTVGLKLSIQNILDNPSYSFEEFKQPLIYSYIKQAAKDIYDSKNPEKVSEPVLAIIQNSINKVNEEYEKQKG